MVRIVSIEFYPFWWWLGDSLDPFGVKGSEPSGKSPVRLRSDFNWLSLCPPFRVCVCFASANVVSAREDGKVKTACSSGTCGKSAGVAVGFWAGTLYGNSGVVE